jgi:hypothetical protein
MAKPFKDIFWYLDKVGGCETFTFDTHEEAKRFGDCVREQELGVDVEIGLTTVRLKLVEETSPIVRRSYKVK